MTWVDEIAPLKLVAGKFVQLDKFPEVGVPSKGVTNVGEVARTTEPEPVVGAALIAEPFPDRIPEIVVERVIAGVLVGFKTVPANPLAGVTETEVTVPEVAGAAQIGTPPDTVSTFPVEPIANLEAVVPEEL